MMYNFITCPYCVRSVEESVFEEHEISCKQNHERIHRFIFGKNKPSGDLDGPIELGDPKFNPDHFELNFTDLEVTEDDIVSFSYSTCSVCGGYDDIKGLEIPVEKCCKCHEELEGLI